MNCVTTINFVKMIFVKGLKLFLLVIAFCSLSIACGYKQDTIKTELYFGLSNTNGTITEEEWDKFKSETLDKTFSGYTLINGNGYWKGDNSQTYSERTVILIYLHKDTPEEGKKIESVIKKYKDQFDQESVLQTNQAIEYYFK